jgi:uncharacterized protein (UPF0332 family)
VTPEADQHLAKARQSLFKAGKMLAAELPDEAGRMADLAGFHAAQALIFQPTGRTPKTHRGVRSQFGSLAIGEPQITPALRRFLTRGYDIKSLADYAIGEDAVVPVQEAINAIETATLFVERIAELLAES